MIDDREMAELLGEAPRSADPSFRFDVMARMSVRARRRASLDRAVKQVATFTLLGFSVPIAQALGFTWADAQPIALAAGVVALAYLVAALTIQGPKPLLARSRAILRAV